MAEFFFSANTFVIVFAFLLILSKIQPVVMRYEDYEIDIGVIYSSEDEAVVQTLNDSVNHLTFGHGSKLKNVNVKAIKAKSSKELLTYDNLSEMSCSVAIFDLSFGDHASFAFAELLGIPLMSFQPIVRDLTLGFPYDARPSYEVYARAIVDVLIFCVGTQNEVKKHVAVLFEEDYVRVAAKVSSIARHRDRFKVDIIPELNLNDEAEFEDAMEVLLQSNANYVLVVSRPDKLSFIVEKAMRMGAINDKSKWFALDLDVNGNISSPGLKGLVGLQISLTNPEKARRVKTRCGVKSEKSGVISVLANDTLYAVVEAFELKVKNGWNHLSNNCFRSGIERAPAGKELLENLSKVKLLGLSGWVTFDEATKSRQVERLDIVNVKELECDPPESIIENVGHWSASKETKRGKNVQLNSLDAIDWNGEFWEELRCLYRIKRNKKGKSMPFEGRHLTVTTILDAPFCMETKNKSGDQTKYEGFAVDLMDELKREMGFTYTLKMHNGKYGTKDENGLWTGLVGELVNKEAHIAIGALTISAIREMDIDFSKPFMDFKVSMLMRKPEKEDVKLFSFLLPFETNVWLSTIAVVGGVTVLIFCLDFFSPSGYRHTAAETGEGAGNELNLFNSLWFTAGSILQQGADNTPRTASGRMLAGSFWFFTLILISTYTANLAAYFTAKNVKSTINSLEDLANQKKIEYGVLDGGSLYTFFRKSNVGTYSTMFTTMKNGRTFVNSTKTGVEKVRNGGFAYLTDGPYLDYYNRREPCNTMMLENLLEAKSYGIGLQRNSELTNDFSVTILKLREEGVVDRLRKKWWDDRSECASPAANTVGSTQSITLDHMIGVFIVLGGGIAASIAFLLVERRCNKLMGVVTKKGSLTSVREQMDQPMVTHAQQCTPTGYGVETKAFNNIDNRKNADARNRGQTRANLSVPRSHFETRLPEVYASAPESNL